jgi:hypothetical protein
MIYSNATVRDASWIWQGEPLTYVDFKDTFEKRINDAGVSWILDNTIPGLVAPTAHSSSSSVNEYRKQKIGLLAATNKVLAIFKDLLGALPTQLVQSVLDDPVHETITKVQLALILLRGQIGGVNEDAKGELLDQLELLAKPATFTEAVGMLTTLFVLNKKLSHLQAGKSDAELKTIVLRKLEHNIFDHFVPMIANLRTMTEAFAKIREQASRSAARDRKKPGGATNMLAQQEVQQALGRLENSGSIAQTVTERPAMSCFNCLDNAHKIRECPAMHCRRCGVFFEGKDDGRYHPPGSCGRANSNKRSLPAVQQQQTRDVRPRFNPRNTEHTTRYTPQPPNRAQIRQTTAVEEQPDEGFGGYEDYWANGTIGEFSSENL